MAYIGPKPSQTLATPTSQYFNGTGSQTVFTLNRAVNVPEDLEVFVNNIQQEPGVGKSYTAIGTTLTFDAAPSSGTANVYVVYRGLAEVTTRLEHDPNAALAATTGTFSGNVDVTGTVTADGLTVDGDVTINSASPELYLMEDDTTDVNTRIRTSVGDFRIETINDAKTSIVLRQSIDHSTGDISFYDTSGNAKFFWDASAEMLGIGTVTPNRKLTVQDSVGTVAHFDSTGTSGGGISLGDANTTSNYVRIRGVGNDLQFTSGNAENMRISADGEVTKPYQPSFMVTKNADQTLVVNTQTTITWENESWDVGGNFASDIFTAPVTGKYYLQTQMRIDLFDTAASYYLLYLTTSNQSKYIIIDPNFTSDLAYYSMSLGSVFDMDAGDTAVVRVQQQGGTASHIEDSAGYTSFSGYLLG